ncbi:MAG: hypothetical protein ACRDF7_07755 [Candidatus Limnocylindrales bacterium]
MSDPFVFWLFLALLGVSAAVIWLLTGHVMRQEDDLAADERTAEAGWISTTIDEAGGDVPQAVVEQVLELHRHYLGGAASIADEAGALPETSAPESAPEAGGVRSGR